MFIGHAVKFVQIMRNAVSKLFNASWGIKTSAQLFNHLTFIALISLIIGAGLAQKFLHPDMILIPALTDTANALHVRRQ